MLGGEKEILGHIMQILKKMIGEAYIELQASLYFHTYAKIHFSKYASILFVERVSLALPFMPRAQPHFPLPFFFN